MPNPFDIPRRRRRRLGEEQAEPEEVEPIGQKQIDVGDVAYPEDIRADRRAERMSRMVQNAQREPSPEELEWVRAAAERYGDHAFERAATAVEEGVSRNERVRAVVDSEGWLSQRGAPSGLTRRFVERAKRDGAEPDPDKFAEEMIERGRKKFGGEFGPQHEEKVREWSRRVRAYKSAHSPVEIPNGPDPMPTWLKGASNVGGSFVDTLAKTLAYAGDKAGKAIGFWDEDLPQEKLDHIVTGAGDEVLGDGNATRRMRENLQRESPGVASATGAAGSVAAHLMTSLVAGQALAPFGIVGEAAAWGGTGALSAGSEGGSPAIGAATGLLGFAGLKGAERLFAPVAVKLFERALAKYSPAAATRIVSAISALPDAAGASLVSLDEEGNLRSPLIGAVSGDSSDAGAVLSSVAIFATLKTLNPNLPQEVIKRFVRGDLSRGEVPAEVWRKLARESKPIYEAYRQVAGDSGKALLDVRGAGLAKIRGRFGTEVVGFAPRPPPEPAEVSAAEPWRRLGPGESGPAARQLPPPQPNPNEPITPPWGGDPKPRSYFSRKPPPTEGDFRSAIETSSDVRSAAKDLDKAIATNKVRPTPYGKEWEARARRDFTAAFERWYYGDPAQGQAPASKPSETPTAAPVAPPAPAPAGSVPPPSAEPKAGGVDARQAAAEEHFGKTGESPQAKFKREQAELRKAAEARTAAAAAQAAEARAPVVKADDARPEPAKASVGAPPKRGLVVANKGDDGRIYYGEPGETHGDLAARHPSAVWGDEGFAGPDGKYLTRAEAAEGMGGAPGSKLDSKNGIFPRPAPAATPAVPAVVAPAPARRKFGQATAETVAAEASGSHPKPDHSGIETEVLVGDRRIPARYAAIEHDSALSSHRPGAGFVPTEGYPSGLQGRNYQTSKEEQDRTKQFAAQIPAHVGEYINTSPRPTEGPPVVAWSSRLGKYVRLSGNRRGMSHDLADDASRGAYRGHLEKTAATYGVDLAAKKHPELVRIVDIDPHGEDAKTFNRESDMTTTKAQTALRQGSAIREIIGDEVLGSIDVSPELGIRGFVNDQGSGETFRRALRKAIPESQHSTYFQPNGLLTDAGVELSQGVLMTSALPVEIVESMAPGERKSIEAVVPQLLAIRSSYPSHDITPAFIEAIDVHANRLDHGRLAPGNLLESQGDFFGAGAATAADVSPTARFFLDYFERVKLKDGHPVKIRAALKTYLDGVEESLGLFSTGKTAAKIAEEAFGGKAPKDFNSTSAPRRKLGQKAAPVGHVAGDVSGMSVEGLKPGDRVQIQTKDGVVSGAVERSTDNRVIVNSGGERTRVPKSDVLKIQTANDPVKKYIEDALRRGGIGRAEADRIAKHADAERDKAIAKIARSAENLGQVRVASGPIDVPVSVFEKAFSGKDPLFETVQKQDEQFPGVLRDSETDQLWVMLDSTADDSVRLSPLWSLSQLSPETRGKYQKIEVNETSPLPSSSDAPRPTTLYGGMPITEMLKAGVTAGRWLDRTIGSAASTVFGAPVNFVLGGAANFLREGFKFTPKGPLSAFVKAVANRGVQVFTRNFTDLDFPKFFWNIGTARDGAVNASVSKVMGVVEGLRGLKPAHYEEFVRAVDAGSSFSPNIPKELLARVRELDSKFVSVMDQAGVDKGLFGKFYERYYPMRKFHDDPKSLRNRIAAIERTISSYKRRVTAENKYERWAEKERAAGREVPAEAKKRFLKGIRSKISDEDAEFFRKDLERLRERLRFLTEGKRDLHEGLAHKNRFTGSRIDAKSVERIESALRKRRFGSVDEYLAAGGDISNPVATWALDRIQKMEAAYDLLFFKQLRSEGEKNGFVTPAQESGPFARPSSSEDEGSVPGWRYIHEAKIGGDGDRGIHKFGALAGSWVRRDLVSFAELAYDHRSFAGKTYDKLINFVKKNFTVYSIRGHSTQAFGNSLVVQANNKEVSSFDYLEVARNGIRAFAGVPFELEVNGETKLRDREWFVENGLITDANLSTDSRVLRAKHEQLRDAPWDDTAWSDSWVGRSIDAAKKIGDIVGAIDEGLSKSYGFWDNINRVGLYIYLRKHGQYENAERLARGLPVPGSAVEKLKFAGKQVAAAGGGAPPSSPPGEAVNAGAFDEHGKPRASSGIDHEAARDRVQAQFDLSRLPPGVRWFRRFVGNFIAFPYRMLANTPRIAANSPWLTAKWAMLGGAIGAGIRAVSGMTKEEYDESIVQSYPGESFQAQVKRFLALPLGYTAGPDGRPRLVTMDAWNMTPATVLSPFEDLPADERESNPFMRLTRMLVRQNVLLRAPSETVLGSSYSGVPPEQVLKIQPGSDGFEWLWAGMKHVGRNTFTPATITGALNYLEDKPNLEGGSQGAQLALRAAGLQARQPDATATRMKEIDEALNGKTFVDRYGLPAANADLKGHELKRVRELIKERDGLVAVSKGLRGIYLLERGRADAFRVLVRTDSAVEKIKRELRRAGKSSEAERLEALLSEHKIEYAPSALGGAANGRRRSIGGK